jgi:GTPase-associated protein 1, N-terminal domain type 2/GTPase-associated protein 1, middle domain
VSYRQAFHTSCRRGLAGHAGFQFNAASSGLDSEQLARIAADHSGYRSPPDAPPEPGPEEIARLPVDLRYLPVEGVGPVVSRTAYVGREFRGRDGEPDSGRFGNYFSHIVVGADGDEPFGGLLPIELWGAPHWSTEEAAHTELPPLAGIEPGEVDLDRVLVQLGSRDTDVLAVVADAALHAVLGGPRLVVVESDPELAAAWVAWASFALPPDRAGELTFACFEGRPRVAERVRMCVTRPACDVDFPPYELGRSVVVVDTAVSPPTAGPSLYGRVLGELAGEGAEAVAAAVRDLAPGLDLAAAGAELAVTARRADLAGAEDLPDVLAVLRQRVDSEPAAALAALAAGLPGPAGSPAAFAAWAELYAAGRNSDDTTAGSLVDTALERLLGDLGEPPAALPAVDPGTPTVPSAGVLVKWLATVSAVAGGDQLGPALSAGARLGLVGCNAALDRELVGPVAAAFADPAVQAAYGEIARAGGTRTVEGVALELAAAAGAGRGVGLLRRAAEEPVAREAVRAQAAAEADFESVAAWELLRAGDDDSSLARVAVALAGRAQTPGHEGAIRGLYGEGGPDAPEEHAELLAAWEAAGRAAPTRDYEAALECLGRVPFAEAERIAPLWKALRAAPFAVSGDPRHEVWSLVFEAAPKRRAFRAWAEDLARMRQQPGATLPRARQEEMGGLAARVAVHSLLEDDQARGIEILLRELGRDWPLELGDALSRRAAKSLDPAKQVGRAFVVWQRPKRCRRALLEVALPRATRDFSAKQLDEVGASLGERLLPEWEGWIEDHPPRRAVSRAVRSVFRRGEERE